MNSITFADGFTVRIGQKVKLYSTRGTEGTGTVIGFNRGTNCNKVCVDMDEGTVFGKHDYYPLATGGFYNAIKTAGVGGGCIER